MSKASPSGGRSGPEFKVSQPVARAFVAGLLSWNASDNHRQMPWKGEKDPYRIWLSEIILQQTRVEQGLNYYEKFINTFPNVQALAAAQDDEVFRLWEGLGYYSRCRNLLAAARHIAFDRGGVFPRTYDELLALKGVGAYTAAAIASFAYNLPFAVLDGNVFRVLSRIFGISLPIDAPEAKKAFAALAQSLLPQQEPGTYNQAIMDFGATVCKPVPACERCFFADACEARRSGTQDLLPIKEKRVKVRERWLNYIVLQHRNEFAIRQRTAKDIWQQLFEFLLIETGSAVSKHQLNEILESQYGISSFEQVSQTGWRQKLTHQTVHLSFSHLKLSQKPLLHGFIWVSSAALSDYAFPQSLKQFILKDLSM